MESSANNTPAAATATVAETIAAITHWLTTDARLLPDAAALDAGIAEKLCAAGVPLERFVVAMRSLHPQVDAFSTIWEAGKALVFREHLFANVSAHEMEFSPLVAASQHGVSSRHRITDTPTENEGGIIADLRAAGMTDYVVLALPFGDGSFRAMTFATRAPRGFSDDQVAILNGLAPALSATVEIRYLRHLAGVLMDTYVGATAGRKVLDGAIKRGSSETIRAVIWFCDLKGFTALSEKLSPQELLDALNGYFEAMTTAIEAQHGEVLKFIGDAVLAIFQPHADTVTAERDATVRALTAARAAMASVTEANAQAPDAPQMECGIALHLGDLLYGNVGGKHRLDFTVIGAAVNLASRIESLTRAQAKHGRTVLVSAAFAEAHGGEFDCVGEFEFKGIAESATVFAPRG